MNIDREKISGMSKAELMAFVKDCCKDNLGVSRSIDRYTGCSLLWAKEVNGCVIFTVLAGMFDHGCLRDANEYVTVSYNVATGQITSLSHYLYNYGGYRIFVAEEENCVKQEIGYGWGSWKYADLNLDLSLIREYAKQDYGCRCN